MLKQKKYTMKTKTINLYEYSELSPKAKEKALNDWNEYNDDPFMQSHMINLLGEELDERGIKYGKQITGEDPDVRYSLANCQGDGFMFIGTFEYKGQPVKVEHSGPLSNHYCHKYTASFEFGDMKSKDVDAFKGAYMEICDKLERAGYKHIEYITSEESFIEACEANGYTFREDGTMENE